MSRVSGENTSFTGRIWSFTGQSSLQTQKAVYLKKYCFHSQLPLWFFFKCWDPAFKNDPSWSEASLKGAKWWACLFQATPWQSFIFLNKILNKNIQDYYVCLFTRFSWRESFFKKKSHLVEILSNVSMKITYTDTIFSFNFWLLNWSTDLFWYLLVIYFDYLEKAFNWKAPNLNFSISIFPKYM